MITKTVYLASIDTGSLLLGYQGENEHIQYAIRCDAVFDDYPSAIVTMLVKAPNGTVYPKEVTKDGNSVLWTVTASDTAYAGGGQVQITFTDDGEVVKTVVANTTGLASLMGNDPPPDPIQDWITEADETLNGFQDEIDMMNVEDTLLRDEIPGTETTVTLDSGGNPTSIVHSANGETVRTDVFVWSSSSVTETRTASGKYITITTNLETLSQTISGILEVA